MAAVMHAAHPIAVLVLAALGCAHTGTRPHEMSVREHDAAAERDAALAQGHAARYDEDAWATSSCGGVFCFSTWSNPTSEHARLARKYRGEAARHRRASAVLRETEARACAGIPERDRDVSPFFHRGDIAAVEAEPGPDGSAPAVVRVRFRPVTGVDADALQRLVDCHLARAAARGHDAPEMPYCPLVPRGVEAEVESLEDGLAVTLRIEESSRAEVVERVKALATARDASDAADAR